MRVVADTNTVISGLFWHGAPRQVLVAARAGTIELYTSAPCSYSHYHRGTIHGVPTC